MDEQENEPQQDARNRRRMRRARNRPATIHYQKLMKALGSQRAMEELVGLIQEIVYKDVDRHADEEHEIGEDI